MRYKKLKSLFRDSRVFGAPYEYLRKLKIKYSIKRDGIKSLAEVTKALNSEGVLAFADFGTLLGLVREKGLLRHDLDIDVGVLTTSTDNSKDIERVLCGIGYKKSREFTINGVVKEQSYVKKVKVDIQYYSIDSIENMMYCYLFYNPGHNRFETKWNSVMKKCPVVKEIKQIPIKEHNIFIPTNAEEILVYKYGPNWMCPDKGWVYWQGPNTYNAEEIGILKSIYLP